MADLNERDSSQSIKVVGANPTTGVETNYQDVDSLGQAKVVLPSNGTSNSTVPTVANLVAGSDGTNIRPLATDDLGRLIVSGIPSNSGFAFGQRTLAATTIQPVRATTYTEPTAGAQRSVSSSSANDTAAGTGARTIRITYYTSTYTGPFTEDLTLNGTTAVNTVATNIQFIEQIDVLTVGSTGSNVGIITLFNTTGGGGGAIGTIAATANQTQWCHHYVATGKTAYITGVSVSHNGTTVGSGGVFILRAKTLNVANSADAQVSDFVRLYGQASTSTRNYGSPIIVPGPARITAYVTPETASSTVYRAAFDYFEP